MSRQPPPPGKPRMRYGDGAQAGAKMQDCTTMVDFE